MLEQALALSLVNGSPVSESVAARQHTVVAYIQCMIEGYFTEWTPKAVFTLVGTFGFHKPLVKILPSSSIDY